MQDFRLSSSSIVGGVLLGLMAVIVPAFLLKITDLAIYVWLPGTAVVSLMGGGGLHDRHGILFLLAGVFIDFTLYSLLAIGALEYLRRHRKA